MTRRDLLRAMAAAPLQAAGKRPNILFLMTDEHRFDAVGYINPIVRTPNLDKLAAQSVVFTRAYTTSPSCVPARASIYTGRYPSQCGAPTYITYLPPTEVTFMSRLRKAGYHTAVVGKQHFGESRIERGYDSEDIVDLTGEGRESSSYHRFLAESGKDRRSLSKRVGRFASRWTGEQKFHVDAYIGERAREWVEKRRPAGKPWFLAVSFHGPHQPFDGLGLKYEQRYRLEDMPLPATDRSELADKPPHFADLASRSKGLTADEIRQTKLSYYSKISMIDDKIGGILDALKAAGEFDNTLILFAVDHGEYMGDFGLMYKAQYLSEALMRIPMLMKPPVANFAGRREDAFVQNFDVAPTCLRAAGVPIPAEMAAEDLTKFWESPGPAARRQFCFMDAQGLQGVRDDRWKLVHYRERAYGELYDLREDPWEKRNLWNDASARPAKAELQARLLDHMIATARNAGAEWNHGAPRI